MKSLILTVCLGMVTGVAAQTLRDIPDQVTGLGGHFENIVLTDFTDLSPDDVFWEISFLSPLVLDPAPAWKVNSADFQFEMSVTAAVISKGSRSEGASHVLAAIDMNNNVRGVANATEVDGKWVFFLTVYANDETEELKFLYYDSKLEQIIKVRETTSFTPNAIIGDPVAPLVLDASIVRATITNGTLSLELADQQFIGSERLLIGLRTFQNPNEAVTDEVTLTVKDNYVPLLNEIPDQIIAFEEAFESFDLDDFMVRKDEDEIVITASGQTELSVTIDDQHIVSVGKPEGWSGSESITFTVTDQTEDAFFSSQTVLFFGKAPDQAPVILEIPDKITGLGGEFASIDLTSRVESNNPEAIKWSYSFLTDSTSDVPEWSVNANDFQHSMSVTASVKSLGLPLEGDQHLLGAFSRATGKIVGLASAIEVQADWFYFLNINNNNNADVIDFKVYDRGSSRLLPTRQQVDFDANAIIGDPLEPFLIEAGYLFLTVKDEGELTIDLLPTSTVGKEVVQLVATDTSTTDQLFDADTIAFEVLNITPPILDSIPDQTIDEGGSLASVNLREFLRGVAFEDVTWEIEGSEVLSPQLEDSIISFTIPGVNYFGSTSLLVTATSKINDQLSTFEEFHLNVLNINDPPRITGALEPQAGIGQLYFQELLIEDPDPDPLNVEVEGLPTWLYFIQTEFGAIVLGVPTQEDEGVYDLTVTVSDSLEVTSKIFRLEVQVVLGLEDDQIVRVYPNPTTDWVRIGTVRPPEMLQILDQSGRELKLPIAEDGKLLDFRQLARGMYYVSFHDGHKRRVRKVLKRK